MRKKNFINYEELENNIGYIFKNKKLLIQALTHSSYVNENKNSFDNERLEFLGDSILSLIVSKNIFVYDKLKEGELTKIRSIAVCEKSLMNVAEKISLGAYIKLGKGEKASGGSKRTSILADATEALIAGIYLDSDFETVSALVLDWLQDTIESALNNKKDDDYKSKLQEKIQKIKGRTLRYEVTNISGPEHDKSFTVNVFCNNKLMGTGKGKNKKDAEQSSAKNALKKYYNL